MTDNPQTTADDQAERQAKSFADTSKYTVGWNYGEGRPATQFEVDTTLNIIAGLRAAGYTELRCFPNQEHGIRLVAERGTRTIDIDVWDEEV